jgi:hypothetical protein
MAEDDLEKKEIEGTVISPDNQNNDEKIIKKESEKEKKTKRDIDNYADFDFEEENIIEPLI